jgi:glutamyl-tRNA synthetase
MAPEDVSRPVRVRIAPSPTGDPHVGTAYIALFNYVFARKHGGSFVLRIEDTDQTRARADSEAMIFEALRWAGLEWDEGPDKGGPFAPYRQSERTAIYAEHGRALLAAGRAYRCFCTADELAAAREEAKKAGAATLGYNRRCRGVDPAESARRAAAGEAFVVRLAVPVDGTIAFKDRLRGDVEIAATQVDDQVLLKSDGFPTYHLANVVDDHLMEISHVIRAEEWISSTPKHVLLYRAFGWTPPEFIHMPLLRNADKSKISKRKNPVSINFYRDFGVLPEALLNFLGNMGWSFGGDREKFSLAEMVEVFDWAKVSLGGPVFDLDKLKWLNEKYLHALTPAELAARLIAWRLNGATFERAAPLAQKRIKVLSEFVAQADFLFAGEVAYKPFDEQLQLPGVARPALAKLIEELVEAFEAEPTFDAASLERATRAFAQAKNLEDKQLFGLIRIGTTGKAASPQLFQTMEVLGKELTRFRLRRLAAHVKTLK